MRKIILVLTIMVTSQLWGQNFAPFSANNPKRFFNVANSSDNDYFFYSDQTWLNGNLTTFHQYKIKETGTPTSHPSCISWGGPTGYSAIHSWLGDIITYNSSSKHLVFQNENSDTLDFDFSISVGDSSLFYQQLNDRYYINLVQVQQESIYTTTDTVKIFRISHQDTLGSPIVSPLNGFEIKIGKDIGLIQFMNTYDFPTQEIGVSLQGQLLPKLGNYQITFGELYPFDVGDILQYKGSKFNASEYYSCPFSYVLTYYVTNRVENLDTVTISFDRTVSTAINYSCPWPNYPTHVYSPITGLVFNKNEDIWSGRPYNYAYTINYDIDPLAENHIKEGYATLCSDSVFSYFLEEDPIYYCDSCSCYAGYDASGGHFKEITYSLGMGISYWENWIYQSQSNHNDLELVYSKIGGVECGTFNTLGLEEQDNWNLNFYPNPTKELITFSTVPDRVEIIDINGRLVQSIATTGISLDVRNLEKGVYFLQMHKGESISVKKLIKL